MKNFTDINHLESADLSKIHDLSGLRRLSSLYQLYCRTAAGFIISDNLKRHLIREPQLYVVTYRMDFSGIWEWHIPELIQHLMKNFAAIDHGDCLWMLKRSIDGSCVKHFCDVVFFSKTQCGSIDIQKKFTRLTGNICHIDRVKLLYFSKVVQPWENSLPGICRQDGKVLRCQFIHNM